MRRAGRVLLWIVTVLVAFGIGAAGVTKFTSPVRWRGLFVGWGYAAWFSDVTGVVEVAGGIALLVPRVASYAAALLAAVMIAAVITLQVHPGGPLGAGGTPAVYVVLLAVVGRVRWTGRAGRAPVSATT